jgi:hypothetical protein
MKILKIIATVVILFMTCGRSFPQSFTVDTLLYNGDKDRMLNLVIMGDGYLSSQQSQYIADANSIKDYFFSQCPFSNYLNYFNVFAIEVPSNQSGTNHPGTSPDPDCPGVPISTADNYFHSTFDSYSIHRLVCITNYDSAANVLANNFPEYDIVLIIVNSPYYGGSGGTYAVTTINDFDVSVHETGHSFGELADEYWSGSPWEAPNESQNSNPSTNRWKNWLYDNGIGIYAFSESPTWFRPHQHCKMRYIDVPFCSVCAESIIENIHNIVNPVYSYSPSDSLVIMTDSTILTFNLDLVKPIPNTLKTEWKINGNVTLMNSDSLQIDPAALSSGNHQLVATILDTSVLTRSDNHWTAHLYTITWTIYKVYTGISIRSQKSSFDVQLYPNPFSDRLTIAYHLDHESAVVIEIIDANGKTLKKVLNDRQGTGNYQLSIDDSDIGMATGRYFIRFAFDNYSIVSPVIHITE